MANITKREFVALDITGNNYLSWSLDAETHLRSMGLTKTIRARENPGEDEEISSEQEKAKVLIFLRHHLHEGLKCEYLTVTDPLELWTNLKERYSHQSAVTFPRAQYDFINLRFQDYKTVSEYNSALHGIASIMKLCGVPLSDQQLIDKTISTFPLSHIILAQTYRNKGYTKYSDLVSDLLVAEQHNLLLQKNHESRPTGSAPLPEANAVTSRKRGNWRGQGRGRGRHNNQMRDNSRDESVRYAPYKNDSKGANNKMQKNPGQSNQNITDKCHRCGTNGHWAKNCRTPKHLVDLYKAWLMSERKNTETNFVQGNSSGAPFDDIEQDDITKLDVADYLMQLEGGNINDGSMEDIN